MNSSLLTKHLDGRSMEVVGGWRREILIQIIDLKLITFTWSVLEHFYLKMAQTDQGSHAI